MHFAAKFFAISPFFSFFLPNFAEKFRQMKKYILDLVVSDVCSINDKYVLVKLTHTEKLPPMVPGQFVEVRVDGSPTTFLRRPISINFVDYDSNELWLLIAAIGDGTRRLAALKKGETLNKLIGDMADYAMTYGEIVAMLDSRGIAIEPVEEDYQEASLFGKRFAGSGATASRADASSSSYSSS